MKILLNEKRYELKAGTKTVFDLIKEETREITRQQYNNIVSAAPFMRRLGGSEYLVRGYTARGYRVVSITSKNPDRTVKILRDFNFE
tara:strand:+ start:548 stop:808 length:261 start_codon:yes stop_codon:yes gene_type:complete